MFKIIIREIFYASVFLLLLLTMMEIIKKDIILAYFNLNLLLIFCLLIGIFIVLLGDEKEEKINE